MTTLTRLIFLIAGILLAMASCKRTDEADTLGITRRIHHFEGLACSGGTVTRYDFQGRQVFVFDDNCSVYDGGSNVYDVNGEQVCFLGGYNGEMYCSGVRFDTNAKNPLVIYRKN